MGLLDYQTQQEYYDGGYGINEHGAYQFVSLRDIIDQFMIAYIGEDKIIPRARRIDVAFHAQRAMQELSFDTFRSCKAMEIKVPSSLKMTLPQDYVNYIKLAWSDGAGVEHILYPASKTSNPKKPIQEDDGSFDFTGALDHTLDIERGYLNGDFSDDTLMTTGDGWLRPTWVGQPIPANEIAIAGGRLTFTHASYEFSNGNVNSRAWAVRQRVDVSDMDILDVSATAVSASASSGNHGVGQIRIGVCSSAAGGPGLLLDGSEYNPNHNSLESTQFPTRNHETSIYDVPTINGIPSYVEFADGAAESTKTVTEIDVSALDEIWILITSFITDYTTEWVATTTENHAENVVTNVTLTYDGIVSNLQYDNQGSDTWKNYKSHTANDNVNKFDDGTYDLVQGERYGIDPQHSQANGSFYMDCNFGKIHFSSNVSGKTLVLHYISDGLGTDDEMRVHKLAEEAMYKWIVCAIMSTRQGVPEYAIQRYKKEKRAATRQAKLRLSNIKLEEITQILRGRSKWIKH